MIRLLFKLITVIHSDRDPRQICLGLGLGMIAGLTPLLSLHNLALLLIILFFRVNISAALLSWTLFSLIAIVFHPLFHLIGLFMLTEIDQLAGLWTALYNAPIVPYTRFNNSIVMGSIIVSILGFYPLYRVCLFMVIRYRETFMERFNQWKVVRIIKASSLYRLYARYSELRG